VLESRKPPPGETPAGSRRDGYTTPLGFEQSVGQQMKKQLFDELVESIKEAGKIHRGEIQASREFVFDAQDVRAIREKLRKSHLNLRG
jgi:hypothetical protein